MTRLMTPAVVQRSLSGEWRATEVSRGVAEALAEPVINLGKSRVTNRAGKKCSPADTVRARRQLLGS